MGDGKKLELKKLLTNRSYMSFWFATGLSMTASNLVQFLLSLYVLEKTGSGTMFASMVSITVLPRLLFTPMAGVQGDRMRRLKMMKIVMFFAFLSILSFAAWTTAVGDLSIALVYVLVVLLEIIEVFYQAAESAILPEIISKDLLNEAMSLSKLDDGIVYVATPAIGTVMYKLFGVQGGLWTTTAFFFLSLLFHFGIRTPHYKEPDKFTERSFWGDFRDGLSLIRKDAFLKRFMLISPTMSFFFSSIYSVVVSYLFLVALNLGETSYGIYRSITASMVIFVPFLVLPVVKRVPTKKLVIGASIFVSLTLFVLAFLVYRVYAVGASMHRWFVILITVIDCSVIAVMMPVQMSVAVMYQKRIKDEFRSRVFSVSRMLSMGAIPLGNMFFGVLTDLLPPYVNFAVAGSGVFICHLLYHHAFRYESQESFSSE